MDKRAIGVFDSGLGGFTVLKKIVRELPSENIIYLGDTARVPYGTRSKKIITQFARQDINFLLGKNVKTIVIACHTVSSQAGGLLEKETKVPVIDAINPTVEAIKKENFKKIGIIGTRSTINSGIYKRKLKNFSVTEKACPLFVPLIEEGEKGSVIDEMIERYLGGIKKMELEALVLACTHYPMIRKEIGAYLNGLEMIDPADQIVKKLKALLKEKGLENTSNKKGEKDYFVTDLTERFVKNAERFMGKKIKESIHEVSIS